MHRRIGQIASFPLAALASCYLGMLFSRLLWDAPHLLVAAFTDAEIMGFGRFGAASLVPAFYVLQPAEAPPLAFAVYAAGAIVVAAVLLGVGTRYAGVFPGWLRLWVVFLTFWTSILLVGSAIGFADRGAGPLAALATLAGGTTTAGRWIVAAAVVMICGFCLTRVLRSLAEPGAARWQTAARLALWFLLPAAVIAVISPAASRLGRLPQFGGPLILLLLAALPALVAIWMRRSMVSSFQPTMRGAILTVAVGAVSLASIAAFSAMPRGAEQPEFDTLTSRHWAISFEQGAFSAAGRQSWAAAADVRLEQYGERLGIPLPGVPLRSRVFVSTKNKRAVTREIRDDQPFTLSEPPGAGGASTAALDQLLPPGKTLPDPRGEPLLLMAQAWGPAASRSIAEAIARYASGSFVNQPLAAYAAEIACEEKPYAVAEVLEIAPRYLSPLVRDALGGAWIESLVEARGLDVLPRIYHAIPAEDGPATIAGELGMSWQELEQAWQSHLANLIRSAPCEPLVSRAGADTAEVHRGISFSHEVGGDWGYGSGSAQRELEKIHQIGADTVAIIPYAFTRAPEETSIRVRTDETDARVIRVIEQARQAGLRVMLKPHLWGRGFTGDMKFDSSEDFQSWWQSYRSWLLHFARLAELYDVELLALGNELAGLTVHEQAWRELIRDVRRIYGGALTYASHWDGEFERVAFWDQLDYIGVNAYFPLAAPGETPAADSPSIALIQSRLAKAAGRFGKPVLFTEVGYSSIDSAAVEPWAEHAGALDLPLQARCYEVIFESFAHKPWFAGSYWWKWPSHGRGGPYDLSHRPNGKPAMDVLRRWFQREEAVSRKNPAAMTNPK